MKLAELICNIDKNTNIDIISDGVSVRFASYAGCDNIPEKYNKYELTEVSVHKEKLLLKIKEDCNDYRRN